MKVKRKILLTKFSLIQVQEEQANLCNSWLIFFKSLAFNSSNVVNNIGKIISDILN